MIGHGLGLLKGNGTAPAVDNPSPQNQIAPRRRAHEGGSSIDSARRVYGYRQQPERAPATNLAEVNQRIRQGAETKQWSASATIPLFKTRKSGPVRFIEMLLGTWRLQPDDAVPLLGFEASASERARVRAIMDGRYPLVGYDIKDRIAFLLVIRSTLFEMFRDEDVENEWLRERHPALDGWSPMALLLDGHMEKLLIVKDYVDEFAGR